MSTYYPYIRKPIRLGKTIIKTRFLYPCAQPHFLQGPELYPAEPVVSFYCTLAKNGAGLLTFHDLANDYQRSTGGHDIVHFAMYDIYDKGCQNYFSHLTHMVHYYGGKLITSMNTDMTVNHTVDDPAEAGGENSIKKPQSDDEDALHYKFGSLIGPEEEDGLENLGGGPGQRTMFTKETIREYIDSWIDLAKLYKSLGFDGALVDLERTIGQFFRESTNHRTDEYGGNYENRCRFLREFLGRARKELGSDFLLVANTPPIDLGDPISHYRPKHTWQKEEVIAVAKEAEPYVDLLHIRADYNDNLLEEENNAYPSKSAINGRILKDAGVTTPIAGRTNYMELEMLEKTLASGDLDMISASHLFLSNEHLGEILINGRGQDVTPCLLCHTCRGTSWTGDWMSHCTVNPEMGMEYRKDKMIAQVNTHKKVAVIGGGPGGMKAALYLKERGHTPVLFEKSLALGGQIKLLNDVDFKWRMRRYLEFLVGQISSHGVEVRLNTRATPDMVEAEGFDACVAAIGALPARPDVKGAEKARWVAHDVFGHESELGRRVVVVGGASTAAEAAIYLAKSGHDVTQVCRKNIVAYELNPIRERANINELSLQVGVKHKRRSITTEIEADCVTIIDRHGICSKLECDDVVVSGGVIPLMDEAASFYSSTPEFYMIGDCRGGRNMREAIADAYAVSMQI